MIKRLALVGLVSAFAVSAATGAAAQDAAAQALFETAMTAMAAGDFARACPALEEVTRLEPDGVGAKVELARCYEGSGRTASAWSQWVVVETLAARQNQADRRDLATEKIAELKPKLATLTLKVSPGAAALAGLTVERDRAPIGSAQWGQPVPVDVGSHVVAATAPGREPWTQTIQVTADGALVEVEVPLLAETAVAPPPPPPAPEVTPPPASPPREEPSSWQRPVGVAVMATGGLALIVGTILGVSALGAESESNESHCVEASGVCDAEGADLRDDAVAQANVSTVAFVAGGALVAGGAVLFLTAPSADDPQAAGVRAVRVGLGGARLEGAF